jgi:hypothetical protein
MNFQPGKADQIEELHERVAQRILNVCKSNGKQTKKFQIFSEKK